MPIYMTGFIDDHTERWKHYHDDLLPLGMILQPKSFREGHLDKSGLYKWVAIDNGRFSAARILRKPPTTSRRRSWKARQGQPPPVTSSLPTCSNIWRGNGPTSISTNTGTASSPGRPTKE